MTFETSFSYMGKIIDSYILWCYEHKLISIVLFIIFFILWFFYIEPFLIGNNFELGQGD